jgi:hypothetical protein
MNSTSCSTDWLLGPSVAIIFVLFMDNSALVHQGKKFSSDPAKQ